MDEEIENIFANMDNLAKPRGVQDVQELAACRKASKDLASTTAEDLQASQASSAFREDTAPCSGDPPASAGDTPLDVPTSEAKQEPQEAKVEEKAEGEAAREQRMKELGVNKGDLAIMLDIRELKEEIRGLKNNFIRPRARSQPDSEEEEGEGRGARATR